MPDNYLPLQIRGKLFERELLEDRLSELLTPEHMRDWLLWVWAASGGYDLWAELRDRIGEHFTEVIIAPVISQPLLDIKPLLRDILFYIDTQNKDNKEKVNLQKEELDEKFKKLTKSLRKIQDNFDTELSKKSKMLTEKIATGNSQETADALTELLGSSEDANLDIEKLRTVVKNLRAEVYACVIEPVYNYYDKKQENNHLEQVLNQSLQPEIVKNLVSAVSNMRDHGLGTEDKKCLDVDDKHLKNIDSDYHELYKIVKQACHERTLVILQVKHEDICFLINILSKKYIDKMRTAIPNEFNKITEELIERYDLRKVSEDSSISNDIFDISGNHTINKTGWWTKLIGHVKNGKSDNYEITIHSIKYIREQWETDLKNARKSIWKEIARQFEDSAKKRNAQFTEAIKDIVNHSGDVLDQRIQQSDDEFKRRADELTKLKDICVAIQNNQSELEGILNIPTPIRQADKAAIPTQTDEIPSVSPKYLRGKRQAGVLLREDFA